MFYLIQTYWLWFVTAALAGAAVGYSTISPQGPFLHGFKGWLRWVAIAFAVGLVVAVSRWLPDRAGLYLETLLGVVFSSVVGSLVGAGLRRTWAQVEAATARGAMQGGDAPGCAAGETRPFGTEAAAAESAFEAADAKAAEESHRAADPRADEEARRAADAKAADEARRTAAAKATEEARRAADAKAAEEAHRAAEAAEVGRRAAEAKEAEAARRVIDIKASEGRRRVADSRATAEPRRAALPKNARREAQAAEETRRTLDAKATEEVHRAADAAAAAEAARRAVHAQAAKEVCRAADAEAAAEARQATDAKASLGARRLTEPKVTRNAPGRAPAPAARLATRPPVVEPIRAAATPAAPVASAAPSKPAGIDAPLHNKADDLKLIKGIGAKNEKICNDLGIYHLAQIADWSSNEAAWVGQHMAFPGRVEREHWIAQAQLLASGGETEHSAEVKAGTIALDDRADAPLDEAQTATLSNLLPEKAAAVENKSRHPGRRPYGLLAPRSGRADNLKRIRGIGPQSEGRLNALGIWHYGQIAAWSAENRKWIGSYLGAAGRIEREKWIDQAKELAAGRDSEVPRRATTGKLASAKSDGGHGQRRSAVVEPRKEG